MRYTTTRDRASVERVEDTYTVQPSYHLSSKLKIFLDTRMLRGYVSLKFDMNASIDYTVERS
jgi:hypothetical protein